MASANEEWQCHNQDACNLLAQNPRWLNDHFPPIILAVILPRPQVQAGAVHARMVVTPVPVGRRGCPPPAAAAPPQLPMLKEFIAMALPPLTPNAGAWLPAAPGQAWSANNVACEAAVVAERFVANTAMAGVGAPIIVDEADAAAMRHPRCINNMEVIDGTNRAILQLSMIGEALKVRGAAAVAEGGTGRAAAANCKLELLLKRCKLAIEVGNQLLIAHSEKMICMLEEKEAREMEGGSC